MGIWLRCSGRSPANNRVLKAARKEAKELSWRVHVPNNQVLGFWVVVIISSPFVNARPFYVLSFLWASGTSGVFFRLCSLCQFHFVLAIAQEVESR